MSYIEILALCIANFGMTMLEARRCTIREYEVQNIAYRIAEEREVYHLNLLAWQNRQAGATKKNGRPVFARFSEMYDYEKNHLKAIKGETPKDKKINSIAENNAFWNS